MFPFLWIVLLLNCLIRGEFFFCPQAQLVDCHTSDREALLDFIKGLENSEKQLSSWKGSNCCQWFGIVCDNITGAVTKVDLHSTSVNELELKSLTYLDLSSNSFTGTIPDFLPFLENLQYLNLSYGGFSGAIPPNLGNLSSLKFLDVSSPSLNVDNLEWMSGLLSLKYLAMDGVDLSKAGVGWVDALNKLPFLTELHLSSCHLSSLNYSLPLVNFSSLAVLNLSNNYIKSKFPNWLVNISSLVSVDISYNRLHGRIPLGFSELPNLQSLDLGYNQDLSASCFQLLRRRWGKIQVLDLSMTKLHGRIPAALGNIASLIYLDLSKNDVRGSIPSSIGRLSNLQFIDLSCNNLTGGLPEFLEEETANCPSKSPLPNLKNFKSSYSNLTGKLPNWIGNLKNLVVLDLSYNLLQGPIPLSFENLRQLSELRLGSNKLNGSLPKGLGKLSALTYLDVSINQLAGVITEAHFSGLSKLKQLILLRNSFILKVNSSWIPPFQLCTLAMGSCNLGPSFPAWLRSQKEIVILDFSNASISGSIPNWFWDMSSTLSYLNVSLNHLKVIYQIH
ncbi:hypothetical protein GH714_002500 [Hevea brasiliensis]|uniref:Uncharacterized protein n=1 Tax=Hevea brasiliensis TaxID=3981 RepID=A0A6A6KZX7_HEVBR|nr:hypothetical protein GH714_002500 [Hevea brasiliensis]